MKRSLEAISFLTLFLIAFAVAAAPVPQLKRAGYGKITIAWESTATGVEYTVYRGDAILGVTTATEYTDSGLAPDTEYIYTVTAGGESGGELSARTLSVFPVGFSGVLGGVVDLFHNSSIVPSGVGSFLNSFKSDLATTLDEPVVLNGIDENIFVNYLITEITRINGATGASPQSLQKLHDILAQEFGSEPFDKHDMPNAKYHQQQSRRPYRYAIKPLHRHASTATRSTRDHPPTPP